MSNLLRISAELTVFAGGLLWAFLAGVHSNVIFVSGWPATGASNLLMAMPFGALALTIVLVLLLYGERTYITLGLASLSLTGAIALAFVEMHYNLHVV